MAKPQAEQMDAPSYSKVTIFAADGVTGIGMISVDELRARPCPVPDRHPPISFPKLKDSGVYATVAASPRRPYKRPVRKQVAAA